MKTSFRASCRSEVYNLLYDSGSNNPRCLDPPALDRLAKSKAKVRNKINTNKFLCIKRADESLKDKHITAHKHTKQAFITARVNMTKGICQFTSREMPDLVVHASVLRCKGKRFGECLPAAARILAAEMEDTQDQHYHQ